MSNSSNLLIYGYGTGNSTISKVWKYAILGAIFCLVVGLLSSSFFQRLSDKTSPVTKEDWYGRTYIVSGDKDTSVYFSMAAKGMIFVGIFLLLEQLYLGQLLSKRIGTTEARVYEDKITGVAVGKDFDIAKMLYLGMGWANAKLTNFDIALNQITSVDLMGDNAIVVNAPGAQYMCFVPNNYEIQNVINNKIRNKENEKGGSL
jgi:hypothetical protein